MKENKYRWYKKGKNGEGAVIDCVVGGRDEHEIFRNYVKMVSEMSSAGWKPYKWKYDKELNF